MSDLLLLLHVHVLLLSAHWTHVVWVVHSACLSLSLTLILVLSWASRLHVEEGAGEQLVDAGLDRRLFRVSYFSFFT